MPGPMNSVSSWTFLTGRLVAGYASHPYSAFTIPMGPFLPGCFKETCCHADFTGRKLFRTAAALLNIKPPYSGFSGALTLVFQSSSLLWQRSIKSLWRITRIMIKWPLKIGSSSTGLSELEGIISSLPLELVFFSGINHSSLTPNYLAVLSSISGSVKIVMLCEIYIHGWTQANYLSGVIWRRWIAEHMPTLQARQKWVHSEGPFRAGNVARFSASTSLSVRDFSESCSRWLSVGRD